MGCCVSQDGAAVRTSRGGGGGGNSRSLATEARDVTRKDAPPSNHDWLERMLLDIGTDLTSTARDFPRMIISVGVKGGGDGTTTEGAGGAGKRRTITSMSSTTNDGSIDDRLEAVRKTLRALIEICESGVEGSDSTHYYALKAAAIGSPVDIASTNADTEETKGGGSTCGGGGGPPHRGGGSTPPMRSGSGLGVSALSIDPPTTAGGGTASGASTPPLPNASSTVNSDTTAALTLTSSNLAMIPKGPRPIAELMAERQKRRVAKLLERFDEEWDACVYNFKHNNNSNNTNGGAATDLSHLLMEVFDNTDMCKKVLLTKAQHQKLLGAKWREVFELTESAPSGEGRVVMGGGVREELSKYRLGLVGDLELNETQKMRKMESTQNFKNLMKANELDDDEMIIEEDSDDGDESYGRSPGNDSLNPHGDGGAPANRNTTGLPRRARSGLVRHTPSSIAHRSKNNSNIHAYKSTIDADLVIEEGESPCVHSNRNMTPLGGMRPADEVRHHFAPIPYPEDHNDGGGEASGGLPPPFVGIEDSGCCPHLMSKTLPTSPPKKNVSSIVRRKPSPAPLPAPTPATADPPAAAAASPVLANSTMSGAPTSSFATAKKETWIANCRAMEVLFYFNQGVMFYPSQRIRYAFWFPWVSSLRDVGWESKIYADEEMTLDAFLNRSRPSSPTRAIPSGFDHIVESPFFAGAKRRYDDGEDPHAGNHKGLLFITHLMKNRNYVGDSGKEREETPEFQVDWTVDIVLDKNGHMTTAAKKQRHGDGDDDGDEPSTPHSPLGSTATPPPTELQFIDGRITVNAVYIKKAPSGIFGTSDMWELRKRLLVDHVYNSFKVQAVVVEEFPGGEKGTITTTNKNANKK